MNNILTINPAQATICRKPQIDLSRMLTNIGEKISREPSILPITVGTSSIGGAILSSLWSSTRSLTPWLGIIGTICVVVGIHCTGNADPVDNISSNQ